MRKWVDFRDLDGKTIEQSAIGAGTVVLSFTDGTYWAGRAAVRYMDELDIAPSPFDLQRKCGIYIGGGVLTHLDHAELLDQQSRQRDIAREAEEMAIYERVKARLESKS